MQTETRLRELTVRYSVKKASDGRPVMVGPALTTARDAATVLMALLQDEPAEVFAIICLSTKRRVITYHVVSRGTLDSTLVHLREVFKAAMLCNSASILLVHNHPSGDPTPSSDDCALTRRLAEAGELLGVHVVDHIVVGDGRYYSLKQAGLL